MDQKGEIMLQSIFKYSLMLMPIAVYTIAFLIPKTYGWWLIALFISIQSIAALLIIIGTVIVLRMNYRTYLELLSNSPESAERLVTISKYGSAQLIYPPIIVGSLYLALTVFCPSYLFPFLITSISIFLVVSLCGLISIKSLQNLFKQYGVI